MHLKGYVNLNHMSTILSHLPNPGKFLGSVMGQKTTTPNIACDEGGWFGSVIEDLSMSKANHVVVIGLWICTVYRIQEDESKQ